MYRTDNYIYRATKEYSVSVDTTIEDIHGYRLQKPYIFSYIPEPNFRPYRCYPLENPEDPNELLNPLSSGQISLYFNSEITSEIFNKISITPDLIGSWRIDDQSETLKYMRAFYYIDDDLSHDEMYTLLISSDAEDKYGNALGKSYEFKIKTQSFVGYWSGASYHTGPNGFEVCYRASFTSNGYLDTLTVSPSLSINPNLTNTITLSKDSYNRCNNFQVKLVESEMIANTNYIIEIDTTLKTIDGVNLSKSCKFSFTTGL